MFDKRITLFCGHYGSGKTFTAVNYAIALRKLKEKVSIYDLDIVNPYYRTVDAMDILKKNDVELVVSPFAETNVDIPAMNSKSYQMISDKSRYAVCDIGGDDRGALALGRFKEGILEENNFDYLLVLNKFRPETNTVSGALQIMDEISRAGRIGFTGIVNSSNLGMETDVETILEGYEFANEVAKQCGLQVKFSSVRRDLINEEINKIGNILPVDPIKYGNWL